MSLAESGEERTTAIVLYALTKLDPDEAEKTLALFAELDATEFSAS